MLHNVMLVECISLPFKSRLQFGLMHQLTGNCIVSVTRGTSHWFKPWRLIAKLMRACWLGTSSRRSSKLCMTWKGEALRLREAGRSQAGAPGITRNGECEQCCVVQLHGAEDLVAWCLHGSWSATLSSASLVLMQGSQVCCNRMAAT